MPWFQPGPAGHDLAETYACVSRALQGAKHEWWVIGSAAVALHGADPGSVGDIDVILHEEDACNILPALGLPVQAGSGDGPFWSRIFATWQDAPMPVELMASLSRRVDGEWREIVPATRVGIAGDGWTMFVPERAELVAILREFGRAKDLRRIAALGEVS